MAFFRQYLNIKNKTLDQLLLKCVLPRCLWSLDQLVAVVYIYSDDIMFYHFTETVSAAYTPFCAYTHIVQVPLPTAWISPSGVTVATAVLLLSQQRFLWCLIFLSFFISFTVICAVFPFFRVIFETFFLFPILVTETDLAIPYLLPCVITCMEADVSVTTFLPSTILYAFTIYLQKVPFFRFYVSMYVRL